MSGVRGVLRTPPDDAWSLHRFEPGPRLAPYAVLHWIVVWDLRGREPHHQTTLPHPSTHLVVEEGGAWLYGPLRERFERTLAGQGRAVEAAGELEQAVAAMEAALEPLLPAEPDPEIELADRAVSLLEADRTLNRVSDLAERLSLSVRSVQRLFADHVGLGPSWVIRRYRLHEAAARATAGGDVDWASLAIALGYYDQAHLVRDFTATVGTAPARYAAGGRASQ
jgi:AraC-like DNA-binding protein